MVNGKGKSLDLKFLQLSYKCFHLSSLRDDDVTLGEIAGEAVNVA